MQEATAPSDSSRKEDELHVSIKTLEDKTFLDKTVCDALSTDVLRLTSDKESTEGLPKTVEVLVSPPGQVEMWSTNSILEKTVATYQVNLQTVRVTHDQNAVVFVSIQAGEKLTCVQVEKLETEAQSTVSVVADLKVL